MTAAAMSVFRGGLLFAAGRGMKDSILPMVRAFLSVGPEHNATPPIPIKAGRGLTER